MHRLEKQLVTALEDQIKHNREPNVPEAGILYWQMFCELSANRSFGATGPNPIQFTELQAWCQLRRWPLQQHHIDIILALDAAFIECIHSKTISKPISDVTPASLDVAFAKAGW